MFWMKKNYLVLGFCFDVFYTGNVVLQFMFSVNSMETLEIQCICLLYIASSKTQSKQVKFHLYSKMSF